MVLMPLDMESSRLLRSLARLSRPWAVKKLFGLSRAELTRLPVASFVWVDVIRSEVCCNCSRFERTPADRTMSDILGTFLDLFALLAVTRVDPADRQCHRTRLQTARKSSWLMTYRFVFGLDRLWLDLEISQRSEIAGALAKTASIIGWMQQVRRK